MDRLDLDPRAHALLEPVLAVLHAALPNLPDSAPIQVRIGEVAGLSRLDGGVLVLSHRLEGPGVVAEGEPESPLPPLDRWRRAAGLVLEAVALRSLSALVDRPPGDDWRWMGAAIYAADAVAPELGIAGNDLAQAIATGDPGRFPRAGVAACLAWKAQGADPITRARDLLDDGVVSAVEWVKLGHWVLERGTALLGIPVQRVSEADIPLELGPWRWQPLRIPAHPRGGSIGVHGDGEVGDRWAIGGSVHRTIAASAAGGARFEPEPGGPVGDWVVTSAEGFGQVMGSRGVFFQFRADGRMEVVLADAFVGPLAALGMAGQVGTSGVAAGRWAVAGQFLVNFEGIVPQGLTMHGRSRDRFMMPAGGFGMGEWLQAMCDAPWGWSSQADRMVLRGKMMGGAVEVRLRREAEPAILSH
jgi:hypothetical protein